ncbi:histone deacetylase [Halobacteriovorax sp. HLS]|uniref:histone deacetylase n=1 Tax=Halobacteriovorax sp. HLS TaxID=2234000 RepID=UPI000FDB1578|nr:histone deacetylase [Halobacteriovorax sp. HLS]
MIIYNKKFDLNLKSYGISVPIHDDRASKTFAALGNIVETPIEEISLLSKSDLLLAHSREFVDKLFDDRIIEEIYKCYELVDSEGNFNRYDPSSASKDLKELFETILLHASATSRACELATKKGFCFSLAGGMHHAMSSLGRGFCLINDIVIAARIFQNNNPSSKVSIIDIDAHKGCGSAQITEHDTSIETLSIHMQDGWPLDPQSGQGDWHIPSTIDIPIGLGEENLYLSKLKEGLDRLSHCELAIVVAGADPYEEDILESASGLKLSKEQMLERDLMVYNFLKERKIAQVWVMAGGYGPKTWEIYAQFLKSIREEESF